MPTQGLISEVMPSKVCLVVGAGAGIGVHTARRFARGGYIACLARRSDQQGLDRAVRQIEDEGGEARGFLLDVSKNDTIETMVDTISREVGEIDVAVYNVGAQFGNLPLMQTPPKVFERGWRLGCEGLFRLARACAPQMLERGHGTLLVTSATAAVRGNAGQAAHAAAMGGRRMLCQSLVHELGPQGVHVCHAVIDGAVDAPDTLGKMLGEERFAAFKEARGDGILQPGHVAETFFHLASQHRSVWTNEIDLRPYAENPWYNSDTRSITKGI